MPWTTVIPLLLQYGLPTVKYIVDAVSKGNNVTSSDIDALIALEKRSAKDEMLAVLQQQGIDPASDQGKAFLALAS